MTVDAPIGREREWGSVEQFLDAVPAGSTTLVMTGEAGIGKTTLWQAAADTGARRGWPVLTARPAEPEARLSYSGLGDLLDGVADEVLGALPQPQCRALEVALLKAGNDGNPPDQHCVSVALLSVLRLLAASSPVVVAIDDIQWLDHPTARVLHFALRRLGPAPVGVVMAVRDGPDPVEPLDLTQGVTGGRLWRIELGPLSVAALHHVIAADHPAGLPPHMLHRVHRASGGNPFFALELARALRRSDAQLVPGQPLPVPQDLRALVSDRLAGLPDDALQALQVIAAVSQPTIELVGVVLGSVAGPGVTGAIEAGVIRAEGGRLHLAHPLLGSVAYYQRSAEQRRGLHRRIAAAVSDPEERARHLALGATGPDAAVAAALDAASRAATARGAPDAGADLCELALRLTPADDTDQARRRAVRAARHHFAAGDWRLAGTQLEEIIDATPPGPSRAHPLRVLGELRYHYDSAEAIRLLSQALVEVGDDLRLRASIELDLGFAFASSGDTIDATPHAQAALDHAERSGEPGLLAAALAVAGYVDFIAGRAGADEMMARAVALEDPDRPSVLFNGPSALAGLVWMWSERQDQARAVFERLHQQALDRGEEFALPFFGFFAAYLACRMGDLDSAARYTQTAREASIHVGGDISLALGLFAHATVRAHAGDVEAARRDAHQAIRLSQRAGWPTSFRPESMLGFVELSLGDAAAAHRVLGPLSEHLVASGVAETAMAPAVPDDIEALVALGELDQAEALLGWFNERACRRVRAWALAAGGRCRGLLLAARGDLDGAAAALEAALNQQDRISLPLERGRTLLVKGGVERRRKHKAAAKQALEEALEVFEAVGASLWAQRATSELTRVNIRPAAPFELTATEATVAELAAAGLSTKQVAEQAFMSPRSVEGVLARIYRKLGVTSRAELANTMAARRSSPPENTAGKSSSK